MTSKRPRSLTRLIATSLAALAATAAAGCGEDESPSTTEAAPPAATSPATIETESDAASTATAPAATPTEAVSREQAISIARKKFPGEKTSKVERDVDDGQQVWKVDLRTAGGAEREVTVAADDGQILKTATNRDDRDDRDDNDRDNDDDGS